MRAICMTVEELSFASSDELHDHYFVPYSVKVDCIPCIFPVIPNAFTLIIR